MDMLLVMLLPMMIRYIVPVITEYAQKLFTWERTEAEHVYERMIEHKKNHEYYW